MKLGILGSMVWDRIDYPAAPPVERWGGIAYAVAAAAAAAPEEWSLRPVIRVGDDLAAAAMAFLDDLPVDLDGVEPVPEANNRVHLRYRDAVHRDEQLSGGVGPWSWEALEPRLDGLDALYVNLISGFELELDTALRLRSAFQGPVYADLHSLVLGIGSGGHRTPRTLPERDRWLGCFDVVQVNERELELVAGDADPDVVPAAAVERGTAAFYVTRGPEGARWTARSRRPFPWRAEPGEALATGAAPLDEPVQGDPTGCGDVWGATCCVALLEGRDVHDSAVLANRAAARNVRHRGADGLYHHLRDGT